MQNSSPQLHVFYRHSLDGVAELRLAGDLAARLTAGGLVVHLPEPLVVNESALELERQRVVRHVAEVTGMPARGISVRRFRSVDEIRFQTGADLVVSAGERDDLDHVTTLVALGEERLGRGSSTGPLVLPFGNGESGRAAADIALQFACWLGLDLELYHTTWQSSQGSTPAEQMCADAGALMQHIEEQAARSGLRCKTTVETADDVVEGLIHFSMRCGACAIAMSRGLDTGRRGSYVTQALACSPIPVLIVGRAQGGCHD